MTAPDPPSGLRHPGGPAFAPVSTRPDFVAMELETLRWWRERSMIERYIRRNDGSERRWSFIDGPITANNPMAVHHAWGRSYKDLYQRYHTMLGEKQRYQNGFDCQGLWIEVEVEKEHGFASKKDILAYGVDRFVQECKDRVQRFAAMQTEQSIRLGYWMDWENSYYTNSDENNYTIWMFLKTCWERGWVYKGHDVMPWCPRCATGLSEHEIVTEGYKELTHLSVYVKFPIVREPHPPTPSPLRGEGESEVRGVRGSGGSDSDGADGGLKARAQEVDAPGESLLVWTTTPWTLAGNTAAAVHPELTYLKVRQGDDVLYVSKGAAASALRGEHEVLAELPGADLVGLRYRGPYDELPVQAGVEHRVIAWGDVSDAEGTGVVHIAPGSGKEDFALSKEHGLAVIAPTDDEGVYLDGFGALSGTSVSDDATRDAILASLREKGALYRTQKYTHRYPVCWRCGTELIFRLVDEWFIGMDELRHQIADVTRQSRWIPDFGLARELDWLKNMDDWMISKKRYYGLALPIYDCPECGSFEVIGSETELRERAVEGWETFDGHSPHKPFIDAVKIRCKCGEIVSRIPDVGNPWLDAGIVPFSTLGYRHDRAQWEQWFPAQFITEAFPGQFRNWFYSLLTMSTALEGRRPFEVVLGHAMVRDERGEEMHKSAGNAIWFEDAADKMGVDVMRWLFFRQNPAQNINFGYGYADEVRRGMFLTLWNTYAFFVTYARLDGWAPASPPDPLSHKGRGGDALAEDARAESPRSGAGSGGDVVSELDRWVISELHTLIGGVNEALATFDAQAATRLVEAFVDDLSNWYVRRSRRRFWKSESDSDKLAAYATLYECLVTLAKLLAPLTPYLAEEMYQNLVRSHDAGTPADAPAAAPESVHLADWPQSEATRIDRSLSDETRLVMRVASLGHAARAKAQIRVRQPLGELVVRLPSRADEETLHRLAPQVLDELNVKRLRVMEDEAEFLRFEVRPNLKLLGQKYGRDVQAIARALAVMTADELASLAREANAGRSVQVAGRTLEPAELLVTAREREGFASAEEQGAVVVVSTELTPDLVQEGLAREIVHRIQNLRKDAGFEIADRIRTYYAGDAEIGEVMRRFDAYVRQETLSLEISASPPPPAAHSETATIDGREVVLGVVRA